MPTIVYPTFPPGLETRLAAVAIAATTHRAFFEGADCPYSEELKGFLKKIVAENRFEKREMKERAAEKAEAEDEGDKFDKMLVEVEDMMTSMESIEDDLADADAADRVAYVKAKTALVEKWINIKEKIYSVREIADFQTIIIEILDGIVDKDQRMVFIDKLRTLRTTEKTAKGLVSHVDAI